MRHPAKEPQRSAFQRDAARLAAQCRGEIMGRDGAFGREGEERACAQSVGALCADALRLQHNFGPRSSKNAADRGARQAEAQVHSRAADPRCA